MPKGVAIKRDHIKQGESKTTQETDSLSTVDKGCDFVKAGEQPQINRGYRE